MVGNFKYLVIALYVLVLFSPVICCNGRTDAATNDGFQEEIIHSGISSSLESSIDYEQISVLTNYGSCGSWGYHPADMDRSCYVDLADFAILAQQWFDCTEPNKINCSPVWIPKTIQASDFSFYYTYQTWGVFEIDSATHSASNPSNPLCIDGKVYDNGIGTHANSQVVIDLNGEFATFQAEIGIQCGNTAGSVIFQVYGDGQLLYDSGIVYESDPVRFVNVSVEGLEELMLIVDDADDGITSDASNWANATLTYAEYSVPINPELHINVAPFARVVTWDSQLTGFHPSRIQELETSEIFPEEDIVPDENGVYTVPVEGNNESCIGLQWYENRKIRSMEIEYAEDSYMPSLNQIRLEWWVGESAWQGDWLPLSGSVTQDERTLSYIVNATDTKNAISAIAGKNAGDIQKIRWIFPATSQNVKVNRFDVRTRSYWSPTVITLFPEESISGQTAQLEMYNGLSELSDGQFGLTQTWDLSQPLELDIRYCATTFSPRSDRTILRVELPDDKFGISLDDVVNNGTVYMPDFGVYATIEENFSPADYKTQISGKLNVLQQVRQMPDQSFTQAMDEVHQSIQDNGPTMLSLACDNEKYVVGQDGTLWQTYWPIKYIYGISDAFHISPVFGDGTKSFDNRVLEDGWLPIVVNDVNYSNVIYHQRTGVAPYGSFGGNTAIEWLQPNPVGVMKFDIENTNSSDSAVSLVLNFAAPSDKSVLFAQVANGYIVYYDNLLWTYVQTEGITLNVHQQSDQLIISGTLPRNTTETLYAYIPGWDLNVSNYAALDGRQAHFDNIANYWNGIMSSSMQIQIPDSLLQNIIKASQVHIMIAARNEEEGVRIVPWCSADRYGPLESESQAVIHGMSMLGHQEFTRRSLDFFISKYNEDGLLTTGYTLMGLGWHLWTLGNDYLLFRNQNWLNSVAPDIEQACNWIVTEREKTKKLDGYGQKMPEYGIMPPGVAADWSRFAYRIRPQGEYYAGLCAVAEAYDDIQYPGTDVLLQKADEFKNEIRRAYLWTQARSPAIHLLNDHWIPYSPAFVTCFGPIGEMYPSEDGGRSWGKDVSMGAHHLVPLGVFGYDDQRDTEWISNYLEDVWFLMAGMGAYPESEVKANWFNLGGFYKVQPYYCRITELYAHKDDIKPFIRAYFNAIPTLINTENLTFWEHFANVGGWNKTHETGWFLKQTRQMLLMEKENDELWIAPFITCHWMQDGMKVAVQDAPTEFGPISFEIQSDVSNNQIHAVIDLSAMRQFPETLVIRFRHPDEILMQSVTVNGNSHSNFDPERQIIRINPAQQQIVVTADY